MPRSSGRDGQPVCAEAAGEAEAIRVSHCRTEDLPLVFAILRSAPESASWSSDSLAATFEEHPSHFLVSWRGEELAGFISGRRILDEGEILNLAVKQEFRRRGIGKVLVKELLEIFGGNGVSQVFLEVRVSNAGALAFYKGLGFNQIGERSAYYRNPDEAALVLARKTD